MELCAVRRDAEVVPGFVGVKVPVRGHQDWGLLVNGFGDREGGGGRVHPHSLLPNRDTSFTPRWVRSVPTSVRSGAPPTPTIAMAARRRMTGESAAHSSSMYGTAVNSVGGSAAASAASSALKMFCAVNGADGGYSQSIPEAISERMRSAVPPWDSGVVLNAVAGASCGSHEVAAACG